MRQHFYAFRYTERQRLKKKVFIIFLGIIAFFVCVKICITFFLFPISVTSSSMDPTIPKNSGLFFLPLGKERIPVFNVKSIKRGDIVYAELESQKLSRFQNFLNQIILTVTFQKVLLNFGDKENFSLSGVYRLVGLPGDSIFIKDYIAQIKQQNSDYFLTEYELSSVMYDVFLDNLPVNWVHDIGAQGDTEVIHLKADEYFIMCDNRLNGVDSRLFGPVSSKTIQGRAFIQYFPFKNRTIFH